MLRRFLGRGRNGMWLGRLALFGLHTWNQNFFFAYARENSPVQPLFVCVCASRINLPTQNTMHTILNALSLVCSESSIGSMQAAS